MSLSNGIFTGQESLDLALVDPRPVSPFDSTAIWTRPSSPVHLHLQHSLLAEPPFPVIALLNLALSFQFS